MKKFNLKNQSIAFFTIFIWGITFICTKHLENSFSALQILFLRYVLAYTVLLIVRPKVFSFQGIKKELYLLAASVSGASLYQYLENLSVVYTSPASVSFITAIAPIFTAILAHKFLKEELNPKIFTGMIISLIGVFLICFGDSKTIETGLLGDIIILCSIWLWAVYSVIVKVIYKFDFDGLLVTRRIFMYSVIAMIPFILTESKPLNYSLLLKPDIILNIAFLGIFASAICFWTWNMSVNSLGATTTSKYLFVMPVITLAAQSVYDRSMVGIASVIGMLIILLGLFITECTLPYSIRKKVSKWNLKNM